MKKVRCAIIGAGWWGCEAHLPALREHPDAEIVAVQTREDGNSQQIADDFGAEHACTTVDEVVSLEGLDGVIVSSTPNMHYAHAKAALERGLHVLIEKPMTIQRAEAEELAALAASKGCHFLVSAPWHYTPHGIEARRLIADGALGSLKMISILMTNFSDGFYHAKSWSDIFGDSPTLQNPVNPYREPGRDSYSDPAVAGGGQIYCQISHAAAYLGFLTGVDPVEVFARFDNAGANVDVYDVLNLKLADGTLVSMASTGAPMHTDRQYEVRVYGTEGMILLELWKGTMSVHLLNGEVTTLPDIGEEEIYPMFEPTRNFVDVMSGKAANGSPAELGVYAMRIIDGACRSAAGEGNVQI